MTRCPRCLGAPRFCICDALAAVPAKVPVALLQHALEAPKVSNTGRFVPLTLSNAQARVFGARDTPLAADDLAAPGTVLLFPDDAAPPLAPRDVKRLVVVDASWSQAKRMVQRVPALRRLPRLSLAVTAPQKSLRDAPPGGLSTLQAVARALAWLGDDEAAGALEQAHDALLRRTVAARGYV
ncbi:MAG: tRNA-uridine aminocarboxypropyltransferase [Myxococcota bacterium]